MKIKFVLGALAATLLLGACGKKEETNITTEPTTPPADMAPAPEAAPPAETTPPADPSATTPPADPATPATPPQQ